MLIPRFELIVGERIQQALKATRTIDILEHAAAHQLGHDDDDDDGGDNYDSRMEMGDVLNEFY